MSKRREKISAFLDNDMHRDELMSFSLSAEASDAAVVKRYQIMGETLRGEMSESSFVDVSHAVRETLADENLTSENFTTENKAAQIAASTTLEKTSLFDLSAWFRPVAGMAVAASVAVVLVVSVTGQENTADMAPVASNTDAQPVVQLVAKDEVNKNNAIDLDPYINQHLEFATQDTLQGRLPYVRAVSFESKK